MRGFILFISLAILASCKTYSDDQVNDFDATIQQYLNTNNLELEKSASGLYYRIDQVGEGQKIQYTDKVSFKYKGELLDGTVFDNQLEDPVEFNVRELIAAWKEIMLELNVGGKAFIIAPPQLGYGTHDLEDIPKNSIIIFQIEVISVQ